MFNLIRDKSKLHYDKHCPIKNSTFKDIKELMLFANSENRIKMISLYRDTAKIIYKNSNNKTNNKE